MDLETQFLYVNPATLLLDIIQLTMSGSKWWTLLKVVEILVKVMKLNDPGPAQKFACVENHWSVTASALCCD